MFNKQTTLDLDGPKLGFSTDPQNLTVNAGTAATFVAIGTATFPSNIPAKFATCLLYTSPSPRDQRGSRMPSSA